MAGDLLRAVAVVDACADRVASVVGADRDSLVEHLAGEVVRELEHRPRGTQDAVVVESVVGAARVVMEGELAAAGAALSALTGLPEPAARSEIGWATALERELGCRVVDLSAEGVQRLPGTAVTNTVSAIVVLSASMDGLSDGSWFGDLMGVWNGVSRSGTLESTIERLSGSHPHAPALAWALVTFESHKHVNLIWHQANKLERALPDRSAADLLGWGWIGLRAALRHYDPDLGYTFSTYACTRIVGAMRDGVRAENPVPKRLNTFSRKAAAVEAELTQVLGRAPTMGEVSASIGVELEQLEILHRTQPQASIEEILELMGERGSAPAWSVTGDDPALDAANAVLADAVRDALAQLPDEDAAAVRLLVMEGLNPTEARAATGATARQLRQRKERALAVLRRQLSDWDDTQSA